MAIGFLTLDDVLMLHADQVARYGGHAGIRDAGLLESAVAQPSIMFGGEFAHADVFEMAGAYLYHIVSNHPFVDGNKRAGAVAALLFLRLNDRAVTLHPGELYDITIAVASGKADKAEVASFFRQRAH